MPRTDSAITDNCSRDPPAPSYGWSVVTEDKGSTACGHNAAFEEKSDKNYSTEGHTKTTKTYEFTNASQVTTDKTTQGYTPTAPSFDIIESIEERDYYRIFRTDDVAKPNGEFPKDGQYERIKECTEVISPADLKLSHTEFIEGIAKKCTGVLEIGKHRPPSPSPSQVRQDCNNLLAALIYIFLGLMVLVALLYGFVR